MKICLINLVADTNYGGNLQRYALCKTLKEMGHEVCYIPSYPSPLIPQGFRKYLIYTKRFILKKLNRFSGFINVEERIAKEYKFQLVQVKEFIHQYIPSYPKEFIEQGNLSFLNQENFDAVLVGSDQVWRSSPKRNIEFFFLDFITNPRIKKIAYAASLGNDGSGYTEKQIASCRELIKQFTAVSVREVTALSVFERFGWKTSSAVQLVLDPTLLLTSKDYSELTNKDGLYSTQGVFSYVLDINDDKSSLIQTVASRLGVPYKMMDTLFPNTRKEKMEPMEKIPSIEQWVKYIATADFVVTDSFHGTMFSIIFHKPFITIANEKRGLARYTPLLEDLGLKNRLVPENKIRSMDLNLIQNNIDWDRVDHVLAEKRDVSRSFLLNNLC